MDKVLNAARLRRALFLSLLLAVYTDRSSFYAIASICSALYLYLDITGRFPSIGVSKDSIKAIEVPLKDSVIISTDVPEARDEETVEKDPMSGLSHEHKNLIENMVDIALDFSDETKEYWEELVATEHVTVMKHRSLKNCTLSVLEIESAPVKILKLLEEVERRPEWDPIMEESRQLKTLNHSTRIGYFKTKGQWPTSPRDQVVLAHKRKLSEGNHLVVCRSVELAEYGPQKGCIRGDLILQSYLLKQNGNKTKVIAICHVDPKGYIPSSLLTQVDKLAVPASYESFKEILYKEAETSIGTKDVEGREDKYSEILEDLVEKASSELDKDFCQISGWELITQANPGIAVYGNREKRALGSTLAVKADMEYCVKAIEDLKIRLEWETRTELAEEIEIIDDNTKLLYFQVLAHKSHKPDGSVLIVSKSMKDPKVPEKEGIVRIDLALQAYLIIRDRDDPGTHHIRTIAILNRKGRSMVPESVISWGIKMTVPSELQRLRDNILEIAAKSASTTGDSIGQANSAMIAKLETQANVRNEEIEALKKSMKRVKGISAVQFAMTFLILILILRRKV